MGFAKSVDLLFAANFVKSLFFTVNIPKLPDPFTVIAALSPIFSAVIIFSPKSGLFPAPFALGSSGRNCIPTLFLEPKVTFFLFII